MTVSVDKATGYLVTGAGTNQVGANKATGYVVLRPHLELKALLNSTTSELRVRLNDGVRTLKIQYQE